MEVYQTHDHPEFQRAIATYLVKETGLVLFHSPAGARRFCLAIDKAEVDLGKWSAAGLSGACLTPAQDQGFAHLFAAEQPDEAALIVAINDHLAQSGP